jgi:tRNA(Ile)-lysidine synthase
MGTTRQRDVVGTLRAAVNAAIGEVGPGLYGIACSGGVDSMALADAAIAVVGATNIVVVTIDHALQPSSAFVADGVATWAMEQGAMPAVRRVVVAGRASVEAAARSARYVAFASVIEELGLAAILLAHTQRDQAETVLMRIVRGTGPAGLAGMAVRRGAFVRPLLDLARADTEAYVLARHLPVWDDPMNRDQAFTRVRVRDSLLPHVRAENPAIDDALVRLASTTREWLDIIDTYAAPFGLFPIVCAALAAERPGVRKRAVALALERAGLGYDAAHLDAIDRLLCGQDHGEVGIDLPGGRVVRSYARLDVRHARDRDAGPRSSSGFTPPPGPYVIRLYAAGDRMRPARLKGRSRKLSDLFIDLKLPRAQRPGTHVMVRTTDHTIVWAEHVGVAHGESSDLAPHPAE